MPKELHKRSTSSVQDLKQDLARLRNRDQLDIAATPEGERRRLQDAQERLQREQEQCKLAVQASVLLGNQAAYQRRAQRSEFMRSLTPGSSPAPTPPGSPRSN